MKACISLEVDLAQFQGISDEAAMRRALLELVIEPARQAASRAFHEVRRSDASMEAKALKAVLPMQAIALTLALEQSLHVEVLRERELEQGS